MKNQDFLITPEMKVRTGSVDTMTGHVYPDLRSLATVSNDRSIWAGHQGPEP